jgi:ribosomal protein S18 acetylase RimI-like enzyme
MNIEIKLLGRDDEAVLARVAPGVFDYQTAPELVAEFLNDPRHHIAVAIDDGVVVGFVSAVHYVHPDKPPELWINEVSVAASHREQGLAKRLMQLLFEVGRNHGCHAAWVGADRSNTAAMKLYASVGGGREILEDFVMFTFPLNSEENNESRADLYARILDQLPKDDR